MLDHPFTQRALDVIRSKSVGAPQSHPFAVTINFHPDRTTSRGEPLLKAISQDGKLKSQFETGTSNGGLTAYEGGERWRWEQRVFDGVYDNSQPNQRPKYGALNFSSSEAGASPRFGSSYFLLKPEISKRATFCYPDSFFEPEHFATIERVQPLLDELNAQAPDRLDAYIETQIHGDLRLEEDIQALVLDPSFKGTEVEDYARELPVEIRWHSGFCVLIEGINLYPDYRGQAILDIANQVAENGMLTPRIIGEAVKAKTFDEQDLKKVWHYLARFGFDYRQTGD